MAIKIKVTEASVDNGYIFPGLFVDDNREQHYVDWLEGRSIELEATWAANRRTRRYKRELLGQVATLTAQLAAQRAIVAADDALRAMRSNPTADLKVWRWNLEQLQAASRTARAEAKTIDERGT